MTIVGAVQVHYEGVHLALRFILEIADIFSFLATQLPERPLYPVVPLLERQALAQTLLVEVVGEGCRALVSYILAVQAHFYSQKRHFEVLLQPVSVLAASDSLAELLDFELHVFQLDVEVGLLGGHRQAAHQLLVEALPLLAVV